jgi:hypothetical protein
MTTSKNNPTRFTRATPKRSRTAGSPAASSSTIPGPSPGHPCQPIARPVTCPPHKRLIEIVTIYHPARAQRTAEDGYPLNTATLPDCSHAVIGSGNRGRKRSQCWRAGTTPPGRRSPKLWLVDQGEPWLFPNRIDGKGPCPKSSLDVTTAYRDPAGALLKLTSGWTSV